MRISLGPEVSAFGKVRFYPEFVGSVGGDTGGSFSDWVDEGIGLAMDTGGARWRDAFQRSRPVAFTFVPPARANTTSLLLGVAGPSEDSFGRLFPFVVSTELRRAAYATGESALPVASERFLAEACDVWALARTVSSSATLLSEAERLSPPGAGELAAAAQDLRAWAVKEGTLAKVWSSLFPEEGAPAASRALRVLVDAVVSARTGRGPASSRSVRLPLGNGGGVAVAFWVEAIRALAPGMFPAAFWPADRAEGEVLLCLGEVPTSAFAQIWGVHEPDPSVLDVRDATPPPPEAFTQAARELNRLVADPGASVSELLARIAGMRTAKA